MEKIKPYISCVVPTHNEAENLKPFIAALKKQLQTISSTFEIIIVDDGSKDNTAQQAASLIDKNIKLLALSRNFGKENALTAGLEHCSGDVAILIDADFQHPIELIPTFIENWEQGYDMVYGVQSDRASETKLKRLFTKFFYGLIGKISKTEIPANAGDFRLLDRKIITALNAMPERSRFMKGLYTWVGFKSLAIPFAAPPRAAGKSSWSFLRLLDLAITGVTAFSDLPLRMWSAIGFIISLIAFILGLYIVIKTLIFGVDAPGYATIVVAITFFGGIQLLSIGILGEYIARIFNEVKQRPKYIISQKIGFE
jgi:glycosyltransferase involved in cell wall biosynthesis